MAVCLVRRQLQGLPWRKGDRVGNQDNSLPSVHPVHAREGQPHADPHVPEEHPQNTDDLVALQCTARQERQRRETITIGNPVHGTLQPNGYINRSGVMVSPAVYPRLFSTTLTFRTPQENHIVSVPFETIEKSKNVFSLFFVSPGHLETIQNLIPGWTTNIELLKQVKNWQSPSRDPWFQLSN